jgi:hypothetical protein
MASDALPLICLAVLWTGVVLYCGYQIGKAQRTRQVAGYRVNAREALAYIRRKYGRVGRGTTGGTDDQ